MNWQVSDLESSRKLKELGVKQESLFYWTKLDLKDWEIQQGIEEYSADYFGESIPSDGISAYTVAELGEMLLDNIVTSRHGKQWYTTHENRRVTAPTEAGSKAMMLIYLAENGLLKN